MSSRSPWRAVAWFGGTIALIGGGNIVLYLVPFGFGSPEWEFGASAQMLAALPLPTMGLAMLVAAGFGAGSRWGVLSMGALLLVLGIASILALALFWTVVPVALRGAPEVAGGAIRRTIASTTLNGAGFGLLYLVAAGMCLRVVIRSNRRSS